MLILKNMNLIKISGILFKAEDAPRWPKRMEMLIGCWFSLTYCVMLWGMLSHYHERHNGNLLLNDTDFKYEMCLKFFKQKKMKRYIQKSQSVLSYNCNIISYELFIYLVLITKNKVQSLLQSTSIIYLTLVWMHVPEFVHFSQYYF